jgi:hypothetical protein
MAEILNHIFVSAKADGADAALLRPSDWNEGLVFSAGVNGNLVRRDTSDATYGASWTSGLTFLSGTLLNAQGTITADAPAYNSTATWNAAGVTFTHWKANVTDTASAAASLLLDLQVGAVSKFRVTKGGSVFSGDYSFTNGSLVSDSADGTILQRNSAGSSFTMLTWGPNTGSFPALKRVGATLETRLADDSAQAGFLASYLSVGTTPATTGAGRFANAATIQFRNAANNADLEALQVTTGNRAQLGSATVPGVLPYTKTDTGDPTGVEGMFVINTFDNTFKAYADGAWRTLASGW